MAHKQEAESIPEVWQKLLKDSVVFRSFTSVESCLVLPGNKHLSDEEEKWAVLERWTSQSFLQQREELQKANKANNKFK